MGLEGLKVKFNRKDGRGKKVPFSTSHWDKRIGDVFVLLVSNLIANGILNV